MFYSESDDLYNGDQYNTDQFKDKLLALGTFLPFLRNDIFQVELTYGYDAVGFYVNG